MLEQGFSPKHSQFLSLAKQELILTGILCNSKELGDWEKQDEGQRRAGRTKVGGWGRKSEAAQGSTK